MFFLHHLWSFLGVAHFGNVTDCFVVKIIYIKFLDFFSRSCRESLACAYSSICNLSVAQNINGLRMRVESKRREILTFWVLFLSCVGY